MPHCGGAYSCNCVVTGDGVSGSGTLSDPYVITSVPEGGGGGSGPTPSIADLAETADYHTPGLSRLSFTLIATVTGTTYYFGPYVLTESHVLTKVQYNLQAVTSANLRVALIAVDPVTLQPTGVTVALPDVLHTTTGQKTITLGSPVTVAAGVYVVGVRADANATFKGMVSLSQHYSSQTRESGWMTLTHRTVTQAYGSWGSPPTAFTTRVYESTTGTAGLLIPFELGFSS